MGCDTCPLAGNRIVGTQGDLSIKGGFLVVTDAPSESNARRNRLLSEQASGVFASTMTRLGFTRQDFVFHGAIQCPFDPDMHTRQERKLIMESCREHMLNTIEQMEPEVIVPLGAEPSRQVLGRAVKITKVRGIYQDSEEHGCGVLPMLHPGYVAMYPQHRPTFNADCQTLARLLDYDYDVQAIEEESLGDYEFIDDLQFLIDQKAEVLSFDIETKGLRWYESQNKILTMQFCTEPGKAYMLVWDHPDRPISQRRKAKVKRQLATLLQNPKTKVIGQNLKYDCVWVYTRVGVRFRIGGDTLMLAALIDENNMDKSQSTLVKRYVPEMAGYDDAFNAVTDKSRMDLVPLESIGEQKGLIDYGCGDVDSCLRLYNVLRAKVKKDKKLFNHYARVALPGLNAFVKIESQGLIVDEEEFERFTVFMEQRVSEQEADLISQIPRPILREHIDKGLKFSRADFVRDILFYHKDGFRLTPKVFTKKTQKLSGSDRKPSTSSKDHLPYFFEECSFTVDLAQHMKDTRLLGTNIRRFRENYITEGRVYPRYSMTTAVTGRTSSEDPNGQNFPKRGANAKAYRKCFIAPPGYVILAGDLSQAELRISADMANDKAMIEIYRNAGDIHTHTACVVMNITLAQFNSLSEEDQYLARFKAKAVNFGFIYGMGWRKFIIYAKTQYGIEFTEEEAQGIRNRFFAKYKDLPAWHKRVRAYIRKHGYIRSYDGRIRHLPMINSDEEHIRGEAERQAINSPVQAFASFLGVISLSRIDRNVDPEYFKPMSFVHDEIAALVRLEHIEWGAKTLKYFMESNDIAKWFGHKMKMPIVADVGFGQNLGQLHEMGSSLQLDQPYDLYSIDGLDFDIPEQVIPPNNGRIICPDYMRMVA